MQALPGTVVSFRLTWPPESYPVSKKQNHVYSVPICNPPVNPFVSSKGIFQSTISRRHCFCVSAEALDLQGSPEAAQDVSLLPVLPLELSSQLRTIRRTSDPVSGPHTSAEPALLCFLLAHHNSPSLAPLLPSGLLPQGLGVFPGRCSPSPSPPALLPSEAFPPCALHSRWHYPVLVSSLVLFSCPLTLFPLEGELQNDRSSEPHGFGGCRSSVNVCRSRSLCFLSPDSGADDFLP